MLRSRLAACPKPWFFIPECHAWTPRMLEGGELRLLVYAALGQGCQGVKYFMYNDFNGIKGFKSSPLLTEEIKKLNREIKILEPLLGKANHVDSWTYSMSGAKLRPGNPFLSPDLQSGFRVYTLWSGDEGVMVLVRNLDYTTDRAPNDSGRNPRFHYKQKDNITFDVRKPVWLNLSTNEEGLFKAVNPLTMKSVEGKIINGNLTFKLSRLDLTEVIWIPNRK
ncbi:MAG: hypothetical protein SGI98_01190 [Verrucomicrobiota bacterium]|nr:hypothetical protein [Verrucomicrobiota bacterium]